MTARSTRNPRKRWRPGLAGQVFIGLVLGVVTGVFLGELAAPLGIIGRVFIGLLQMTVLPYIVVSLSAGLGRLSYAEAKTLALRGGGFIPLFWAIALAAVVAIALSFPAWKSAAFFSASLVEPQRELDFIELYIPTNPFFSLANTIVPAIVVFSLALGAALIGDAGQEDPAADPAGAEDVLLRIAGAVGARCADRGLCADRGGGRHHAARGARPRPGLLSAVHRDGAAAEPAGCCLDCSTCSRRCLPAAFLRTRRTR